MNSGIYRRNSKQDSDAVFYLQDLVRALDSAFISTWQSTAAWQKELDASREWLNQREEEINGQD